MVEDSYQHALAPHFLHIWFLDRWWPLPHNLRWRMWLLVLCHLVRIYSKGFCDVCSCHLNFPFGPNFRVDLMDSRDLAYVVFGKNFLHPLFDPWTFHHVDGVRYLQRLPRRWYWCELGNSVRLPHLYTNSDFGLMDPGNACRYSFQEFCIRSWRPIPHS